MTFSSLLPPLLPTSQGEPAPPGFTGRRLLASLPEGISRSILYGGSRDARSQPVAACELHVKAEVERALGRDGVFQGLIQPTLGSLQRRWIQHPPGQWCPCSSPYSSPLSLFTQKGPLYLTSSAMGLAKKRDVSEIPQLGLSEPVLGRCEM